MNNVGAYVCGRLTCVGVARVPVFLCACMPFIKMGLGVTSKDRGASRLCAGTGPASTHCDLQFCVYFSTMVQFYKYHEPPGACDLFCADAQGRDAPAQIVPISNVTKHLQQLYEEYGLADGKDAGDAEVVFTGFVQPLGYSVYRLEPAEEAGEEAAVMSTVTDWCACMRCLSPFHCILLSVLAFAFLLLFVSSS